MRHTHALDKKWPRYTYLLTSAEKKDERGGSRAEIHIFIGARFQVRSNRCEKKLKIECKYLFTSQIYITKKKVMCLLWVENNIYNSSCILDYYDTYVAWKKCFRCGLNLPSSHLLFSDKLKKHFPEYFRILVAGMCVCVFLVTCRWVVMDVSCFAYNV